jgi:TonB family protein
MALRLDKLGSSSLLTRSSKAGDITHIHLGGAVYEQAAEGDKKTLRWAAIVAVLIHLGLLIVTLPSVSAPVREVGPGRPVYVVQQVRFRPPPPRQAAQTIPKRQTKRIPFPDPTPDDPEPIVEEDDLPQPELDVEAIGDLIGIPGPPGSQYGLGQEPMWVGEGVTPPQKVYSPQPRYTEEARQARIQGVVILQAVIDAEGNVSNVKVIKGLPEGLDASAVETVKQWKFKPAQHAGKPVPVFFNLTVSFSLQ